MPGVIEEVGGNVGMGPVSSIHSGRCAAESAPEDPGIVETNKGHILLAK